MLPEYLACIDARNAGGNCAQTLGDDRAAHKASFKTKAWEQGHIGFGGCRVEARHFGPVTADIEPVSANRGLRFRETGFYGQR
jgi:hypothetical protein